MSEEEYFTEEELEEIADSYSELKEKLEELLIDNEDVAETFFEGNAELANEKIEKLLDFLDELISNATGIEEVKEEDDEDEDKKKE
jgi:hypothetical protein